MSRTLQQIFTANPITTNASTDLMYFAQSPYSTNHDAGMTYANFSAQFSATAPNPGITIGGTAPQLSFSLSEVSNVVGSTYTTPILSANWNLSSTTAYPQLTSVNLGSIQQINNAITFTLATLTSLTGSVLLNFLSDFTLNASTLTTLSFPDLVFVGGTFSPTLAALTTLSLPSLVNVGGNFSPALNVATTLTLTDLSYVGGNLGPSGANITSFSFPALTYVGGNFGPVSSSATSISAPNLTVTGAFSFTLAAVTTANFPSLISVASFQPGLALCTTLTLTSLATVTLSSFNPTLSSLVTLSLPALISIASILTIVAPNMTTFSMGNTLKAIGGNFTMTGMKLTQASVDGILASLAALDGTGGTTAYSSKTVNLSGGTSSTPSAAGLVSKATLVARGCTVTTN
jgi:hypothetical protein